MNIRILTDRPVACDSPDHIEPHGTAQDNFTNPRFNRKLASWIRPSKWRILDLGCSGGGFVKSVLDGGGLAVGVEGSDYSQKSGRAEWATIPSHLFTADATEPFEVIAGENGVYNRLRFNLITGWEFLEHIRTDRLPALVNNIDKHLECNGLALFSVAPFPHVVNGVQLHQTVQPKEWWLSTFEQMGFVHHESVIRYFRRDVVRDDLYDASFRLALTRAGEHLPHPQRLSRLLLPARIKKMLTPPGRVRERLIQFIEGLGEDG